MLDSGATGMWALQPLFADFSGWPGFLGTRGSFMLDLVFVAMFIVVPVMFWSIIQVRKHRRYERHRWVQTGLGLVLAAAVAAFEVDMRIHGWRDRAAPSPFWQDGGWNDWVDYSLAIHLGFAIPNTFLWVYVIVQAWRHFPKPAQPNAYSQRHRTTAWLATLAMTMTAVTGWIFYYLAFIA